MKVADGNKPIVSAPPGDELDQFHWHVGAGATVGFLCGAVAIAVALALQLWIGKWVLSAIISFLFLFLTPPVAGRFLSLLMAKGGVSQPAWLAQLGRLWMRVLPALFRLPQELEAKAAPSLENSVAKASFPSATIRLSQRIVREVMVPRPDVVAVSVETSVREAAKKMLEHGVSRCPVFSGDLDSTEGVVHVKDLLGALVRGEGELPVKSVARPARFVPETKPLAELFREMQETGFHLAVVSDEYGSVTGVVSLEDLLEELVGQIADEFDQEAPEVVSLPDGSYRVQASLPIVDLNELLGVELPHASWNTVGGLVFGLAGRIPEEGCSVELEGVRFVVERVQGRRIMTVLVQPRTAHPAESQRPD